MKKNGLALTEHRHIEPYSSTEFRVGGFGKPDLIITPSESQDGVPQTLSMDPRPNSSNYLIWVPARAIRPIYNILLLG